MTKNNFFIALAAAFVLVFIFCASDVYASQLSGRERHFRLMEEQNQMMNERFMKRDARWNKTKRQPPSLQANLNLSPAITITDDALTLASSTASSTDILLTEEASSTTEITTTAATTTEISSQ